jgi:putative lipoprotein
MKIKLFISFAAFVAASALMSSCSKEENTATTNDKLTAFTGGIVTEVPMERVQIGTPDGLTLAPGIRTRTSMNREKIGGGGTFHWEKGDEIYVVDDNNKLCKSQNKITESASSTIFLVDGTYTGKDKYDVYYYGTKTNLGAEKKEVVIADKQTQVAFNNTKHFGAAGDCGVAKAKKTTVEGESGYSFDLAHKASYICFLPYIPSQQERSNFKLKRIEITSKDDNISGTYNLTENGLSGKGNSKTITLNVGADGNGLELADKSTATKSINNSLYVVIAPGERKLSVKYTVFSDNKELTLTKNYKSHNFAVNQICDIPVSIGFVYFYSGHNYYMWDAKENYWSGHEWDSDVPWQPKGNGKASNDPTSEDAARWYHKGVAFDNFQNSLFRNLPNAQELTWYVMKGDAHWDNTTRWEAFGQLHTGGIWLKKLRVIAQKNGKTTSFLRQNYPGGIDPSKNSFEQTVRIQKFGKPDNIKDYFFLPALGIFSGGTVNGLGSSCLYWSSTPNPYIDPFDEKEKAYSLYFNIKMKELKFGNNSNRDNVGVAQHFE